MLGNCVSAETDCIIMDICAVSSTFYVIIDFCVIYLFKSNGG